MKKITSAFFTLANDMKTSASSMKHHGKQIIVTLGLLMGVGLTATSCSIFESTEQKQYKEIMSYNMNDTSEIKVVNQTKDDGVANKETFLERAISKIDLNYDNHVATNLHKKEFFILPMTGLNDKILSNINSSVYYINKTLNTINSDYSTKIIDKNDYKFNTAYIRIYGKTGASESQNSSGTQIYDDTSLSALYNNRLDTPYITSYTDNIEQWIKHTLDNYDLGDNEIEEKTNMVYQKIINQRIMNAQGMGISNDNKDLMYTKYVEDLDKINPGFSSKELVAWQNHCNDKDIYQKATDDGIYEVELQKLEDNLKFTGSYYQNMQVAPDYDQITQFKFKGELITLNKDNLGFCEYDRYGAKTTAPFYTMMKDGKTILIVLNENYTMTTNLSEIGNYHYCEGKYDYVMNKLQQNRGYNFSITATKEEVKRSFTYSYTVDILNAVLKDEDISTVGCNSTNEYLSSLTNQMESSNDSSLN